MNELQLTDTQAVIIAATLGFMTTVANMAHSLLLELIRRRYPSRRDVTSDPPPKGTTS